METWGMNIVMISKLRRDVHPLDEWYMKYKWHPIMKLSCHRYNVRWERYEGGLLFVERAM